MDSSLLSGSGFGEVTFTQMLNSISFFKIHCDIKVKVDPKTQASETFVVLTQDFYQATSALYLFT